MSDIQAISPVYRYFVADLLSNEILAEVPFGGVSYERAIKSAGKFSGNIPINEQTEHLGVYENTMPGKTALYVVRDGVCVWGGIVWARSYNVVSRVLEVSASEFTSYFFHRLIWKTWNQSFGCTLVVAGNLATATLDSGATEAFKDGSSVKLEFYDMYNIRYDGYYNVAATPAPTTKKFYLDGPYSTVKISSIARTDGVVLVTAKTKHGLSTGDLVTINVVEDARFNGSYKITTIGGSAGTLFTYDLAGTNYEITDVIDGTATRPIPDGVYSGTTVIVRTDTYDYIRSLIDAVFNDFVGVDFPNVYIEPGITTGVLVSNKQLTGGYATIKTSSPHEIAIGQAVQVSDVDPIFDGEHVVTATPDDYTIVYLKDGEVSSTAVSEQAADITTVSAKDGLATVNTSTPHNFIVGQNVTMETEYDLVSFHGAFNGVFEITATPTPSKFQYQMSAAGTLPEVTFKNPQITVGANITEVAKAELIGQTVTLTMANPHELTAASLPANVTVDAVDIIVPIMQKSYDAATKNATITTKYPHGLTASDSTSVYGLSDSVGLSSKKITGTGGTKNVTITTTQAHNISSGQTVTITDMQDVYTVVSKSAASNVMTLGTDVNHNISTGNTIVVDGVGDTYALSSVKLVDNVAQVGLVNSNGTAVTGHNIRVNDSINIASIHDSAQTESKELVDGVAYLTMVDAHNYTINSDILVRGVGAPFDGKYVILDTTDTRIIYETTRRVDIDAAESEYNYQLAKAIERGVRAPQIDPTVIEARTALQNAKSGNGTIPPTKASTGYVDSKSSVFNGTHTVSAVTASTIKFNLAVNDVRKTTLPAAVTSVSKRKSTATDVTLTVSDASKFSVGDIIVVSGINSSFNGTFQLSSFSVGEGSAEDTITYKKTGVVIDEVASGGAVQLRYELTSADSVYNGVFAVSATTSSSFSYSRSSTVLSRAASSTTCSLVLTRGHRFEVGDSIVVSGAAARYNGTVTVTSINVGDNVTITYQKAGAVEASTVSSGSVTLVLTNASSSVVPYPVADGDIKAIAAMESVHNGVRTATGITRNTFTFSQALGQGVPYLDCFGVASTPSIFNGTNLNITSVTDITFEYSSPVQPKNNVLETPVNQVAYAIASQLFNGTYAITSVDTDNNKITYNLAAPHGLDIAEFPAPGRGHSTVLPIVEVSTFGPFPGNANIGIEYSTRQYSGVPVIPKLYRGYELSNVGEVLSKYADNIDGFEYRIDCVYDAETNVFRKIFKLMPINFPAPPLPGEVSPISRFGADKLVFEYPGNISDVSIEESAENSATRFFAVGENDLGPSAGPPFSVASSTDLLDGSSGRKWPLLDADEKVSAVNDETALYAYAAKYLTESRPPDGKLTVNINGSLEPVVGSYGPGDWCSLIVEDRFIQARLLSDLEPRDTVIVRKIDVISVSVPDGTTFPEKVDLTLIPEWEVDKRG
jgi:uncharacterized Zn finger protein